MKVVKFALLFGFLVIVIHLFWQIGWSEFSNVELQDDLQDIASRLDVKTGWSGPAGPEEIRSKIIHKAKQRGIDLKPNQVTVEGENADMHLGAAYDVNVTIVGDIAFRMHFSPASK